MSEQSNQPKSPFPEVVAIHFPLGDGGVGIKAATVLRAKEDRCTFKEHPHEVEVWIRPPAPLGRKVKVQHFKVPKARITYIEYAQFEE